jgi:hypothetical protein
VDDGEEPSSGSSKKRRKTETKAVASPKPTSKEGAKGVALGAAVAAQHPPLGRSPGTRKRRRSSNLTVKIGDEVKHVASPPVSAPQSKEEAPTGVQIQAEDAGLDEDLPIDSVTSAGSNAFWQNDGEQDAGGELPIASHFSPITPFLPATTSNEAEQGHATASGLAITDERPTSAVDDAVPPSPFSFLWSPAVGQVRERNIRLLFRSLHLRRDSHRVHSFQEPSSTTNNLPIIAGFTPRLAGGAWPSLSPAKYIKSLSSKVSEFISPRFF